jgi:hypothetical protein
MFVTCGNMCRVPLIDVIKKEKYNASINLVEMCYA